MGLEPTIAPLQTGKDATSALLGKRRVWDLNPGVFPREFSGLVQLAVLCQLSKILESGFEPELMHSQCTVSTVKTIPARKTQACKTQLAGVEPAVRRLECLGLPLTDSCIKKARQDSNLQRNGSKPSILTAELRAYLFSASNLSPQGGFDVQNIIKHPAGIEPA